MYLVAESTPINSRQGNYILSRATDLVARLRLGCLFPTVPEPLSISAINKVYNDHLRTTPKDVMVAIGPEHFPYEVMDLLRRVSLESDFTRFCKAIVFCSYMTNTNGQWANGFVMEQSRPGEQANPFSFSPEEIQAISQGYLEHPANTIFINFHHSNGRLLNNFTLFPIFVSLLGRLKSRETLTERGMDPDTANHSLKATLATFYTYAASHYLFEDLLANDDFDAERDRNRFAKILRAQMMQLHSYIDRLDPKDHLLIHELSARNTR